MNLNKKGNCLNCSSKNLKKHRTYKTLHNGSRDLYECIDCGNVFSETQGTPMQDIKSPISKVAGVLKVRSEGLGVRATGRYFGMHKNTVIEWEERFSAQKAPLMLHTLS